MDQFGLMVGLDKKNAFEGWFCKIEDSLNQWMFSVIWGYSTNETNAHAFIQFQNSLDHSTKYLSYSMEEFAWDKEKQQLRIGKNTLSKDGVHLDFVMETGPVLADYSFTELTPIQKRFLRPNIMGVLTYVPNECNHSIISMKHRVSGFFQYGEKVFETTNAVGYMEKDWGTSFPRDYVWLQVNDWDKSAVVFSYATVPVLGKFAKGFFLVLHHEGQEYRFSSIEGSRLIHFDVSNNSFEAKIQKGKVCVAIKGIQTNPVSLASPQKGAMSNQIKESLDGVFELNLMMNDKETVHLRSEKASIDVHFNKI